jgi:hypothetical protein
MIRAKKRADFERHRDIADLNVLDMLIFKSRQDYQETMNCWKTEVSGIVILPEGSSQTVQVDGVGNVHPLPSVEAEVPDIIGIRLSGLLGSLFVPSVPPMPC